MIKEITNRINPKNKFILFFLFKAFILYLIWYCTYDLWLKKVGYLDTWLVDNLVYLSAKVLLAFNLNISVDYHSMSLANANMGIFVGRGCNGLELFALFTGFILIFEGNWKNKLWYIPVGILIIHFLNVLRIIGLVFAANHSLEMLEFNHKYTFTIIMYIITFLGWVTWVKYFAKTTPINHNSVNETKVK